MTPWLRYGLIAGIIAFAGTLFPNLAIAHLSPTQLCRTGLLIIPLLSLGAFLLFVTMAAVGGFLTARAGSPAPDATLAGLLVGVLSGCALIVMLAFISSAANRFQEVSAACPGTAFSGGGSFSFNFGPTPPPGFVMPTPPPGAFFTPPPDGFATPPPGAFALPTGPAGVAGELIGMTVTILIGIGIATGAATIAGFLGASARSRALERGAS